LYKLFSSETETALSIIRERIRLYGGTVDEPEDVVVLTKKEYERLVNT